MRRATLTPVEQTHLQKAKEALRKGLNELMHINKDRRLTRALNMIFDAADIMDEYIMREEDEK